MAGQILQVLLEASAHRTPRKPGILSSSKLPVRLLPVNILGLYRGYIGVISGLYKDNGKEDGNYYLGFRFSLPVRLLPVNILGLYWGVI